MCVCGSDYAGHSPESVVDDGALVELVARVQQLCGDDGGVVECRGFTAHFLTVQENVLSMGPDN